MERSTVCSICSAAVPAAQQLAGPMALAVVAGVGTGAATKSFWGGLATAVLTGLISHAIVAAAEPICGGCRVGAARA